MSAVILDVVDAPSFILFAENKHERFGQAILIGEANRSSAGAFVD